MEALNRKDMKILSLDIETSPNLAYTFEVWNTNIRPQNIVEPQVMLCWSAKWLGESGMYFSSVYHDGKQVMLDAIHQLLDEADVVMHYNGKRFDIPHINRELLQFGYAPPSPYKQIDLYHTVKRMFMFPSKKLDYVAKQLGLGGKEENISFDVWIGCMANDPAAWEVMRIYNMRDVELLEELYYKLQPWIPQHPSYAAHSGRFECPACGSSRIQRRGYAYTGVSKFQRLQCQDCFKWSRSTHREHGAEIAEVFTG